MISQINIKDHTANFQGFIAAKYATHKDTQAFINGEKVSSLAKMYKYRDSAQFDPVLRNIKISEYFNIIMLVLIWFGGPDAFTSPKYSMLGNYALLSVAVAYSLLLVSNLIWYFMIKRRIKRLSIMKMHASITSKQYMYLFFLKDSEKKLALTRLESLSKKEQAEITVIQVPHRIEYMLVLKDTVCCFDSDLNLVFAGALGYLDELKRHVSVRYLDVVPMYTLEDIGG